MKILLFITILFLSTNGNAQSVDEVIKAERAFATYARDYNTNAAFLTFSDTNAVVFNNGHILNVKKVFTQIKPSETKLLWEPLYSGISNTGELGFSTGPYEVRASQNDSIVEAGSYSTIWHKSSDGQWKFLVDIGIKQGKTHYLLSEIKKAAKGKSSKIKHSDEIVELDKRFIKSIKINTRKAFLDNLHPESCLNIKGAILQQGKAQWLKVLDTIPENLEMLPLKAGISSGKDLAYVYGSVKFNGKTENYLRIWQNTDKGWKIIVQTLNW